MKFKQKDWTPILVVVGILALVWFFGGFREGFTTVNPIITQADFQSFQSYPRQLTPNATTLLNWAEANNVDMGNGFSQLSLNAYKYGQVASQSVSGTPTLNDFYVQFLNATDPGLTPNTPGFTEMINQIVSDYALGTSASAPYQTQSVYKYYFGTAPPPAPYVPPTPTPSPPSSSSTPSTPPASTPSSAPSSSSSVQIPTPCTSSYRSIPGGSMEFKCFGS